jgi:hypothetical protein
MSSVGQVPVTDAGSTQRTWRSIGAVLGGIVVGAVASLGTDVVLHVLSIFPPWGAPMSDSMFVLATAYRLLYTVVGGYVTARLAPARPIKHAVIAGFVGVVANAMGVLATWDRGPEFGPRWYPLVLLITALPCAWVGGRLATAAS